MKGMGRPLEFNQEIADDLCEWIADGKSVREYIATKQNVASSQIYRWLERVPEFREQYARAFQLSADSDADHVKFYGQSAAYGHMEPQAAKVAIDALKWCAGRRNPKKYGDKITHAGDAENPITSVTRVERVIITAADLVKPTDDDERT